MTTSYGEKGGHRTALVLYGSETGNAHDIADTLGHMVERLHFSTYVTYLDAVDPVSDPQYINGFRLMSFSHT